MTTASFFRPTDPTVDFKAGEVIFTEGDAGSEMYGIIDGAIELRHGDRLVERLGAPGVFGEMALIDHRPRNLTATAIEDTKLAVIDERHFLWLVHETPTFALQVMGSLAERIRDLNHTND